MIKEQTFKEKILLRDIFILELSHGIKTPLSAILGLSEVLLDEVYGEINEKQRLKIQMINNSGDKLLKIINNIFDLLKIETGKIKLNMQECSIEHLCFLIKQSYNNCNDGLQLRIQNECVKGTRFETDIGKLKQLITTIVSNLNLLNQTGTSLSLIISKNKKKDSIKISILWKNKKFDQEIYFDLLNPLTQSDRKNIHKYTILSLNFYLARRMVEMLGGSFFINATENSESYIEIIFPH